MHVVFVAPECAPFVKTGGLGEVLGALPAAVARLGHRVTVFLPYYRAVRQRMAEQADAMEPAVVLQSVTVPFPETNRFVRVLDGGTRDGVSTYLVDCPEFFDRDGVYGPPGENYPDNALRYGLYCRAVLEASKLLGVPEVFHMHDWQSAFVAVLLRTTYANDPMLQDVATVFTIHNGGYQGKFPAAQLRELLLPESLAAAEMLGAEVAPKAADTADKDHEVNPFLGGLRWSDAVTTVSPTYAEELKTAAFGEGLEAVYRERGGHFVGILNGIDVEEWNPATDLHLAAHYSVDNLRGKRECRRDLLHAVGADRAGEGTAVIGMVSRLAAQKGFDLLAEAMPRLAEMDVLLVIVGQGEPELVGQFQRLAEQYPDRLKLEPEFYEGLAHKVQAGADMALMPSRYEPSGLTQLYSLRYGTVPVVRATGGLCDSVQDGPQGNGFAFEEYTADDLVDAVERAVAEFRDPPRWQARMRRGMERDSSWDEPSRAYESVYAMAVEARQGFVGRRDNATV